MNAISPITFTLSYHSHACMRLRSWQKLHANLVGAVEKLAGEIDEATAAGWAQLEVRSTLLLSVDTHLVVV